jgi:hypothetical protein
MKSYVVEHRQNRLKRRGNTKGEHEEGGREESRRKRTSSLLMHCSQTHQPTECRLLSNDLEL